MDHNLVMVKGLGKLNEAMSHAMQAPPPQDRWVIVKSSHKMWSTGGGNGKPLQCIWSKNPMNSTKRQKI